MVPHSLVLNDALNRVCAGRRSSGDRFHILRLHRQEVPAMVGGVIFEVEHFDAIGSVSCCPSDGR